MSSPTTTTNFFDPSTLVYVPEALPYTEYVVNQETSGDQVHPQTAALAGGGYVITWMSDGQDGSGYGVYARVMAANGVPVGDTFRVNTTTTGAQDHAQVTGLADGGFVVVWDSYGSPEDVVYDVHGQRFNASGQAVGSEFIVNSPYRWDPQWFPAVTATSDGGFVAAWSSFFQDRDDYAIVAQRFDAQGAMVGDQFIVNSDARGEQTGPFLLTTRGNAAAQQALDQASQDPNAPQQAQADPTAQDGFWCVWRSLVQDGSGWGIFARRYATDGTPQGDQFQVNTHTDGNQLYPNAIQLADGSLVIAWNSDDSAGNHTGIWARKFSVLGEPQGAEFQLNTSANTYNLFNGSGTDVVSGQRHINLLALADGGFMGAWNAWNQDGSAWGQVARSFEADGTARTDEWVLNTYNYEDQRYTSLVASGSNGLIAVWQSMLQDGSGYSIVQRAFGDVGPVVDIQAIGYAQEGGILLVQLSHPRTSDASLAPILQYRVNWDDGTTDLFNAADMPYDQTFSRDVTDGGADRIVTVDVSLVEGAWIRAGYLRTPTFDAPPTLESIRVDDAIEGQPVTLALGAISDLGTDITTQLKVRWGDGQHTLLNVSDPSSFSALVQHVYAGVVGTQTIYIDALDEEGWHEAIEWREVTIQDVVPTLTLQGAATVAEGASYTLTLGAITDPGGDTVSSYRIDWGDGQTSTVAASALPANRQVGHSYADGASGSGTARTISVDLTDVGGTHTAVATRQLQVTNAKPQMSITHAASVAEGASLSLTLGAISDAGSDSATQVVVNWGDGSSNTYNIADLPANRVVSHTYAGAASRSIQVDVRDEDGLHTSVATGSVTVTDVAPSIGLTLPSTVAEGASTTLRLGAISDSGPETVTQIRVNWGDGQSSLMSRADYNASVNAQPSVAPSLTHSYADSAASRTVTVDLQDNAGWHLAAGTAAIAVTNVAPTASLSGAATAAEGNAWAVTIGSVVDPGQDTVSTYRLVWGDGTTTDVAAASLASNRVVTHSFADDGTMQVQLQLVDEDGTHNAGLTSVNVSNVAPQMSLSGAATATEGRAYTLTLGSVTDPGRDTVQSYTVDWGDGSVQTLAASELPANRQWTHTYADQGAVQIRASLRDDDGTWSQIASHAVTVQNQAPTISLTGAATVSEGSAYTLTLGAVTDPGTDTVQTYRVNWGDGQRTQLSAAQVASSRDVQHTYADGNNTYTVTVDLIDEDGTWSAAGSRALTVTNLAPTLSLSAASYLMEGTPYLVTLGNWVDPGVDTVSALRINWGDGQSSTIAASSLPANRVLSHNYALIGQYNVSVDLTDEDGTHLLAGSTAVTVSDVAPLLSLSAPSTVAEGQTFALTLGAITDPGGDTVTHYRVDWGDGQQQTYAASSLGSSRSITHAYADDAAVRNILVDVLDASGWHNRAASALVAVSNVNPSLVLSGADTVAEGATYALTLGSIVDPGTDTVSAITVRWGDGAVQTLTPANVPANRTLTHTYTDGATSQTITVGLQDEDGTVSIAAQKLLQVTDIAPVLSLTGDSVTYEGTTYSLTLGSVSDPGADTVSAYRITWGDGQTQTVQAADLSPTRRVEHIYADGAATAMIRVDVVNEDGSFTQASSLTVDVRDIAPMMTVQGAAEVDEGSEWALILGEVDDPGADTPQSYQINWGDGQIETVLAANLPADRVVRHRFADGPGVALVAVSVIDEEGSHAVAQTSVRVVNVAPTLHVEAPAAIEPGSDFRLVLGIPDDPGADTPQSWTVSWGDGSSTTVAQSAMPADRTLHHTYTQAMTRATWSVSFSDEDGLYERLAQASVDVGAGALGIDAGVDAEIDEGTTLSREFRISDLSDDGAAGWSYDIDWGDGARSTGQTLTREFTLSHRYSDGSASHTLRASVADAATTTPEAADWRIDQATIEVNNLMPTVEAALKALSAASDAQPMFQLTWGQILDAGDDTVTGALIRWGDGSATLSLGTSGTLSHRYANNLGHQVSIDLIDEDGTHAQAATLIAALSNGAEVVDDTQSYGNLEALREVTVKPTMAAPSLSARALGWVIDPACANAQGDLRVEIPDPRFTGITVWIDDLLRVDNGRLAEAGRMQLLDAAGQIIAERTFFAEAGTGAASYTLNASTPISSVRLSAGTVRDGQFVPGAYALTDGTFGQAPSLASDSIVGSDFRLSAVDFIM